MSIQNKEYMTVPEAGARLGLGRCSSYKAARAGQIPIIRLGGLVRVPVRAFERLLENGNHAEASSNHTCSCIPGDLKEVHANIKEFGGN